MSNHVKDAMSRIFEASGAGAIEVNPAAEREPELSVEERIKAIKEVVEATISAIRDQIRSIEGIDSVGADFGHITLMDHTVGVLRAIGEYVTNEPDMRGLARAATMLTNSMGDVRDKVPNELWDLLTLIPAGLPKLELRIVANDYEETLTELKAIDATFGDFTEDQILMAKSHVVLGEGEYDMTRFLKESGPLFTNKSPQVVKYLLDSIRREMFAPEEKSIASDQIRKHL